MKTHRIQYKDNKGNKFQKTSFFISVVIHGKVDRTRQTKASGEQAKIRFGVKDTKQPYTRVPLGTKTHTQACKTHTRDNLVQKTTGVWLK